MRRRLALAGLLLVALRADALPTFVGFAAGSYVQGPDVSNTVPNVLGLTAAAADTALMAAGLDTGALASRCSSVMSGKVVVQNPAAGTLVGPGSLVDLLTSNGTPCRNGRGGLSVRRLRLPGI